MAWLAFALALLGLVPLPAVATADTSLVAEIRPAWGGRFLAEATSEVEVLLAAPAGGDFELRVSAHEFELQLHGTLEADGPSRFWLPLRPGPGGMLRVEVTRRGFDTLRKDLILTRLPQPLTVILAGSYHGQEIGGHYERVRATPPELPHTQDGYGAVRRLILGADDLRALTPDQSAALASYLLACGELLLVGGNRELLKGLRRVSGCGGGAVTGAGDHPPPRRNHPLSPVELKPLLDTEGPGEPHPLLLFFAGYGVLLLLIERALRNKAMLLALPPAASLALWLWPLHADQAHLVIWAEMNAGDPGARIAALLRVDDARPGNAQVPLPAVLPLPTPLDSVPLVLAAEMEAGKPGSLRLSARPFNRLYYGMSGSVTLISPLSLQETGGPPLVQNIGREATRGALLSWQGDLHEVPPLPAGGLWLPSADSLVRRTAFEALLLQARTGFSGTALLLPHVPPAAALSGERTTTTGWLLIWARENTS